MCPSEPFLHLQFLKHRQFESTDQGSMLWGELLQGASCSPDSKLGPQILDQRRSLYVRVHDGKMCDSTLEIRFQRNFDLYFPESM